MTDIPAPIADRIADARGFIFDMDGTIALGDSASGGHRALPHAVELLRSIKARGVPVRVFTNGSAKSPAVYAASLRAAGFDLDDTEMMTPSSSAAAWYVSQKIGRVRVLGIEGGTVPLREAGIEVVGPSQGANGVEAVYTAWFREFDFPALEAACGDVWAGAQLTTASDVPFFATAAGRAIGSSFAINAMITAMTKAKVRVLGKPSRIALAEACRSMGIPSARIRDVVVVGDDPALEMRMANDAGAISVGVTTGMMDAGGIAKLKPREKPALLIDTLRVLRDLIG